MNREINENFIQLDLEVENKEEAIEKMAGLVHSRKRVFCKWKENVWISVRNAVPVLKQALLNVERFDRKSIVKVAVSDVVKKLDKILAQMGDTLTKKN